MVFIIESMSADRDFFASYRAELAPLWRCKKYRRAEVTANAIPPYRAAFRGATTTRSAVHPGSSVAKTIVAGARRRSQIEGLALRFRYRTPIATTIANPKAANTSPALTLSFIVLSHFDKNSSAISLCAPWPLPAPFRRSRILDVRSSRG
jgi:hypothetical protein